MFKKLMLTISLGLFSVGSFAVDSLSLSKQEEAMDMEHLTTVLNDIKKYYVSNPDEQKLFNNALKGMVASLDPHSAYLDPEAFKDMQISTQGEFGGLGLEVTNDDGYIKVISPIDGSPGQKAGIKPGDTILALNGKLLKDLSLREVTDLMRGKPGSVIKITLVHKNDTTPKTLTLKRDIIRLESVKGQLFTNRQGYIRISHFQKDTTKKFESMVKYLEQQNKGPLKGLILDLRNNPGGLLDSAIIIANDLLDDKDTKTKELIVYTKGRSEGSDYEAFVTPGDITHGAPLVVLINEGSASASEILAGALQDNRRAIIAGQKSFGKGSVQTVLPLGNNTGIKLTTALYYTPAGRSIQASGIEPDVILEDLTIDKEIDNDEKDDIAFSEAGLKGHLQAENTAGGANVEKDQNLTDIAVQDFQLYLALKMLKGISIYQKNSQ